MKKKLLTVLMVCTLMFCLTGCDLPLLKKKTNNETKVNESTEKKDNSDKDVINTKDLINDNDSYFVKIKGTKFTVGDKIANISKVGLKQDSRVLDKTIGKNTYLIGGGSIYNESDKNVMSMTAFNATSEEISVRDAVIGGIEAGTYEYAKIEQATLDLNLEFVGGIKLGDSLEDIQKVFGTTENIYEATSLGYKVYTYKSDEVYRSYEFTIDKEGKLSKVRLQNLVFNR
ncbi:MAG: hypothetical protein IK997_07695 [Bacilli bacterium]|nr:hypothetical protein [Bacilli bacterium]